VRLWIRANGKNIPIASQEGVDVCEIKGRDCLLPHLCPVAAQATSSACLCVSDLSHPLADPTTLSP
jgi:hypothetical protein